MSNCPVNCTAAGLRWASTSALDCRCAVEACGVQRWPCRDASRTCARAAVVIHHRQLRCAAEFTDASGFPSASTCGLCWSEHV